MPNSTFCNIKVSSEFDIWIEKQLEKWIPKRMGFKLRDGVNICSVNVSFIERDFSCDI